MPTSTPGSRALRDRVHAAACEARNLIDEGIRAGRKDGTAIPLTFVLRVLSLLERPLIHRPEGAPHA